MAVTIVAEEVPVVTLRALGSGRDLVINSHEREPLTLIGTATSVRGRDVTLSWGFSPIIAGGRSVAVMRTTVTMKTQMRNMKSLQIQGFSFSS
mgnify:CR=1 FL=1